MSVIDELPPGRTPIVTRRTTDERAEDVWEFVSKQVEAGRQAYVVYPVIEGAKDDQPELDFARDEETGDSDAEAGRKDAGSFGELRTGSSTALRYAQDDTSVKGSKKAKVGAGAMAGAGAKAKGKGAKAEKLFEPKKALRAATDMYEELRTWELAGLRLGLLHGRLSADEKEVTMRRFQRGEIDVLIATTVIEVGVDVPNATVMVIEHAERFGLAQMHQLRGRVGRGAAKSLLHFDDGRKDFCEQAEERLEAMVRTQNGFELAELDLQQRGPGSFLERGRLGCRIFAWRI